MATAWCSPTAHPRTHKSSNKEEEEDDDDAAVQQLHDCAVLYKSLEVFIPNPKIPNLLTSLSSEFMKQPKHSLTHSLLNS
jgi:hypothetical protein